jgi:hypothetical protein
MDIDGIGYEYDFVNQQIHIQSNVKVSIRPAGKKPSARKQPRN